MKTFAYIFLFLSQVSISYAGTEERLLTCTITTEYGEDYPVLKIDLDSNKIWAWVSPVGTELIELNNSGYQYVNADNNKIYDMEFWGDANFDAEMPPGFKMGTFLVFGTLFNFESDDLKTIDLRTVNRAGDFSLGKAKCIKTN
jgi:hypothetical protein